MALTREERKLLHQKSKQPTFGNNKPNIREGNKWLEEIGQDVNVG